MNKTTNMANTNNSVLIAYSIAGKIWKPSLRAPEQPLSFNINFSFSLYPAQLSHLFYCAAALSASTFSAFSARDRLCSDSRAALAVVLLKNLSFQMMID